LNRAPNLTKFTSSSALSSSPSNPSNSTMTSGLLQSTPDPNLLSEKVKKWSADVVKKDPWYPFTRTHSSKSLYTPDCPLIPDKLTYPKAWPIKELLDNWNTDSTDIPPFHHDSLCHFDFRNETELQMSYKYREMELPYVMRNVPQLDEVVEKWANVDYLANRLGARQAYGTGAHKIDMHTHYYYIKRTQRITLSHTDTLTHGHTCTTHIYTLHDRNLIHKSFHVLDK